MRKIIVLILLILISLSLSSCKTKRNLIKENDTKVATTQVVTSNDTTKWIREILDIINKQIVYRDTSSTMTTTLSSTENSSNDTIITTTTTQNDIELTIRVDIAKDETIKEQKDVHLTDSTTTINTSKIKEDINETKDTRLIQGVEWVYVIFTTMVVIGLIVVLVTYRR